MSLNGYTSTVRDEIKKGIVSIDLLELKDILRMAKKNEDPTSAQKTENTPSSPPPPTEERELIIKLYERISDEDLPDLLGKSVRHKQFGDGVVIDIIDRKYIDIYFPTISECKKFVFPDSFADKYIIPIDFKLAKKG